MPPRADQLLHLFNLLPSEAPPRTGGGTEVASFSCGAYSQGRLQGLRANSKRFPNACSVFASFVRHKLPEHQFTTLSLFRNLQTDCHVDSGNLSTPNAVFAISQFQDGGIWVGDGKGPQVRDVKGKAVKGTIMPLDNGPVVFDAYKFPHSTEKWQGERLVLVAYAVKDLSEMHPDQAMALVRQGFNVPPQCPFPFAVAQQDAPPVRPREAWFFEVFSGKASLSAACAKMGFKVLAFDHVLSGAQAATVPLDLRQEPGRALFWQLIERNRPVALHGGPPCGTSSRARERPLPKTKFPNAPRPLRSLEFPLGLPTIRPDSIDGIKLRKANALYKFMYRLILFCIRTGILISVENPSNSHFWGVMEWYANVDDVPWPPPGLEFVTFDACMHGSSRPKRTSFLGTKGVFSSLHIFCDGAHEHAPWGLYFKDGCTMWSTSAEASYPSLLSKRIAQCLADRVQTLGFQLGEVSSRPFQLAPQGTQSSKFPPLIPEFCRISWEPASFKPDKSCRILFSHASGVKDGGDQNGVPDPKRLKAGHSLNDSETPKPLFCGCPSPRPLVSPLEKRGGVPNPSGHPRPNPCGACKVLSASDGGPRTIKVGHWLAPDQHVAKAKEVSHPFDLVSAVEELSAEAVDVCMSMSDDQLVQQRKLAVLKLRIKAKTLERREQELHKTFPPWFEKLVAKKKLLLWESLLRDYAFDDLGVIKFMMEGAPIVGQHDTPSCFKSKLKPAVITEAQLRESAEARREAMILKSHQQESHVVKSLEETAKEEVEMGILEGPMSADEVSATLGHNSWSAIRRFGLDQGSKIRPIDDGRESQTNNAFTSDLKLDLQGIDYMANLAMLISRAENERSRAKGVPPRKWVGKTVDLKRAYKQVPLHPSHRDLVVVFQGTGKNQKEFFLCNSLLFGLSASVFSFARIARSLWFILSKVLNLPLGNYFDDYPVFSTEHTATSTDSFVGEVLDLLGWDFAREGSKGVSFSSTFNVLGAQMDVSCLHQGTVVLANKAERIEKLLNKLKRLEESGSVSVHEAQVLLGWFNFASGFYAGKPFKLIMRTLTRVIAHDYPSAKTLSTVCKHAMTLLQAAAPRLINCFQDLSLIVHIWTDGSWEDGRAGIGAVVLDLSTGRGRVFQGFAPPELTARRERDVGTQIICEVELFALLAVRIHLQNMLHGRKTIFWIDNDSARATVIKGSSKSAAMFALALILAEVDNTSPTLAWIERVPSFSNVADWPSRQEGERAFAACECFCSGSLPLGCQPDCEVAWIGG